LRAHCTIYRHDIAEQFYHFIIDLVVYIFTHADAAVARVVFYMYTVNLPNSVTLGEAYDESVASPVGLQGHVI